MWGTVRYSRESSAHREICKAPHQDCHCHLSLQLCFLFVCLVGFFVFLSPPERVSPNIPGCPTTSYVDQAGLKLTDLPASASRVLELKVCTTTASLRMSCFEERAAGRAVRGVRGWGIWAGFLQH